MIEEYTRPMTAAERWGLESALAPRPVPASAGDSVLAAVVGFAVVASVATMLLPESWAVGARQYAPLWAGLAAALAALIYVRRAGSPFFPVPRPAHPELLSADLEAGVVEVAVCHVVDATRVEESEDEGSQYLLRLVDGRGLFHIGQHLYECEEERRFPCTRVEVIRAPRSGHVLDVHCAGDYLPPSAERPAFTEEEHAAGLVPDDGEVIDAERYERLRGGGGTAGGRDGQDAG